MIKICLVVFMKIASYSCQILVKTKFSLQIFEKYPNIKFHDNPSSGSRVFACRQRNTTKETVAFRNSAHAPENCGSEHTACGSPVERGPGVKTTSIRYSKRLILQVRYGLDRAGSGQGQVAGTCECSNKPSCSI